MVGSLPQRVIHGASSLPRYFTQSFLLRHLIGLKLVDRMDLEVPGHLRLIEGLFLYDEALKLPAGGVAVEIGSYLGRSTTFIGAALKSSPQPATLHAIDTFTSIGVPGAEGHDTLAKFTEHTAPYASVIRVHQGYSTDIVKMWNAPIDMLWIDGDHSYEACSRDIQDWVPFVRKGGLVAFHDYANPCGVAQAVDEHMRPLERRGSAGLNGSIYYARKG